MKVLLINVDAPFNLAIRRLYNYYLTKGHLVDMKNLGYDGYPSNKSSVISAIEYDIVYISNIFDVNKDRVQVVGCENVIMGGIGSNHPNRKLDEEVERTKPYYFEYEDTSIGFITRGCIRNCWFCKVPKHEGKLTEYNTLEEIVQHKNVKLLDNNILAYHKHAQIFKWLIENKIRCDFNQGLDYRLITEENAFLLSKLKYIGEYKFAFDSYSYKESIERKLTIIKKYIPKPWKLKFYVYQNADMPIHEMIARVEWCRENECLPYLMRDINCWESEHKEFYIDYAAYCNQPSLFKKLTFKQFLYKRHKNQGRIKESLKVYNSNKEASYERNTRTNERTP